MNKKRITRFSAAALSGALAAVLVGCGSNNYSTVVSSEVPVEEGEVEEEAFIVTGDTTFADFERREETVHISADPEGNPKEITVETRLSGIGDGDAVRDYAALSDIRNTDGDEDWIEEEGASVFENLGRDIVYEGNTEAALPVAVHITYFLDGKEIAPEALAGQSGRVKIRFDYESDEKKEGTRVPFLFLSGAVLPGDTFSDIEVTNGRVISMDDSNIAIGYALPGVWESITPEGSDAESRLPEYVEIEADAEDFELDFTATIAMNGLFAGEEEEEDDEEGKELLEELLGVPVPDMEGISGQLEDLESAMSGIKKRLSGLGQTFGISIPTGSFSTEIMDAASEYEDFEEALDDLKDRFEGLREADRSYTTFAGTDPKAESSVRFLFETEEIKAE